ncbi:hypothetical protein [Streptomyces violaceusniger]|uniref:Lipoprotein n=1 Tax=Streptomyces violaceusniger (strain Tu 4113) TaxID=653045 RepID=G2P7B6_STRV4|nr:hypothetical protein [Streptomyces violaceusniger]AEM87076.1 hypothetical protein Strvi_7741 [Streptomyces violaceusniger Tu 4113]
MRTIAITAAALMLAAAAVGCSSNTSDDKPAKAPTSQPAKPTPTLDPTEARAACVDAIAKAIQDDNDPEETGDRPAECKSIADSDWLDAYMDGLHQRNQKNLDSLGGS